MPGSILVLNSGSSSLKFALFDVDPPAGGEMLATARGEIQGLDVAPRLVVNDAAGAVLADQHWGPDLPDPFAAGLHALLTFADSHLGNGGLRAVGHRIVHGGADHITPARVTTALMRELMALTTLDPLHMPHNLAPIVALATARPSLPQVVCFDTAFHSTLPPVARRTGLPRALEADGIRRYGFHGLSYEYVAGRLAEQAPALARGRVVVAHLGSGASLCALRQGRSIATTMGFSALDGLLMATRCGSLDPGIILHLGRAGHSFADIEDMLYRRSGLLGVSDVSDDIRRLLESDDPHAGEAIELFTYRIAAETAAMACALGGLDGIVFTAGIGEHAPAIRAAVCARLAWLGVALDPTANAANAALISQSGSRAEVRVIATDEEVMIAQHTKTAVERTAA
ncbi:MAG: acetate/propionate family kinase [Pseudomonadota bacterium]|nr:acetate/propionate family kinase [Pseudomonadota bacterium]